MTDSIYGWMCSILVTFIVAFGAGWVAAHQKVSIECVRQGSFYFIDKDFDCSVRRIEEGRE